MSPEAELELFVRLKAVGADEWLKHKLAFELEQMSHQQETVGVFRAQGRVGLVRDMLSLLDAAQEHR